MRQLLLLLGILLLINSCGSPSSGTATETSNTFVVLTQSGTKARNVQLLVVENNNWYSNVINGNSPILDTLFTDSLGVITIDSVYRNETFQISSGQEALILDGIPDNQLNEVDTVRLFEGSTIKGITLGSKSLFLSGTAYEPVILGDSFYIDNVPPGTYTLYGEETQSLPLVSRVHIDTINNVSVVESEANSLLFEDFLGGFDNNPLKHITTNLRWYLFTDSFTAFYKNGDWDKNDNQGSPGNSTITPSATNGKARFDVYLGDKYGSPFAGVGAIFNGSSWDEGYDLTGMTGLQVSLSGTGKLFIEFESAIIDSINDANGSKISDYKFVLDLPSTPVDTVIKISDFHLPDGEESYESLYPLNTMLHDIKNIDFIIRGKENSVDANYWFEIDEIIFQGVTTPL